jgi:hypothetical protein
MLSPFESTCGRRGASFEYCGRNVADLLVELSAQSFQPSHQSSHPSSQILLASSLSRLIHDKEANLPPTPCHITISVRFNLYRFMIHVSPSSPISSIVDKLRSLFPQHVPMDGVVQLFQEDTGCKLQDDLELEDYAFRDGEEVVLVYHPTIRKKKEQTAKTHLLNIVNVSRG